jgi:hypothetical protein
MAGARTCEVGATVATQYSNLIIYGNTELLFSNISEKHTASINTGDEGSKIFQNVCTQNQT